MQESNQAPGEIPCLAQKILRPVKPLSTLTLLLILLAEELCGDKQMFFTLLDVRYVLNFTGGSHLYGIQGGP